MTLSIIIPAYNASNYVDACLDSLCSQDLAIDDYEIIVVNDGSTDDTVYKVKKYVDLYKNISLISQENKGNGAARNTGLKFAKGDYIYFLDSDDYIAQNTLGTITKLLITYNLDIIGFSSKIVNASNEKLSVNINSELPNPKVMSGISFLGAYNYKPEVWWYISKKTLLTTSEFKFYDRKFVQDSYLTPTLFSDALSTLYTKYDIHRYRMSENSITRSNSESHLKQHFEDLSYAVKKLYLLRNKLSSLEIKNSKTLERLHVKQQRYVFIMIVRFIKSRMPLRDLKNKLSSFRSIEAYPLNKFMSNTDHRKPSYLVLTFIFNRTYLLFPIARMYRIFKALPF